MAVYNCEKVILSILQLLTEPNTDDPLNPEASQAYRTSAAVFAQRVRQCMTQQQQEQLWQQQARRHE